jgi:Tol biopolymer transport system component
LKGEIIEGVGETLWARHGLYLLKGSEDPIEICEIGDSAVTLPFAPEPNEKCRPLTSDRHRPGWRSIALIFILLIAVGVGAWWFGRAGSPRDTTEADARRSPAEPLPVRRYTERLPAGQSINSLQPVDTPLALSPDGSMLVYVGAIPNEPALILRRRNELEGTVLPGTQRGTRPAFSPDGRWIVFTGYEQDTRKLMKISVDGETVVPLADAPISFPAVWSEDGYIYYTPRIGSGLMRVRETGGEPETVTSLEGTEMSHSYPRLIAGRNAIGFASFSEASIDSASMNVVDLDTGERKTLLEKSGPGPYLPTGHILVIQKERFMAARFDIERLEFAGPLFDVTESAMAAAEAPPTQFAIAQDGTLVYVPQELNGENAGEAVWYQDGVESRLPLPFGSFQDLVLSSDGRYILLKTRPPGVNDMWMYDRERQNTTRLTHTASWELGGIFGPRDEFVYFVGNHDTAWAIYRLPINDPDRIQTVISTDFADAYVTDITNDGRALIVSHRGTAVDYDISILHLHENAEPEWQSLFTGDYTERGGVLSPDEKWIAYESNESGRYEVYVQAFPELGNKVKVSVDGGVNHRWSHDGDTLFYRHPGDGPFYRVRLTYDPRLAPGLAEKFLEGDGYLYPWDVAPDGSGFVLAKRRRGARQGPGVDEIVVVENWFEEIRRLEPRQTN